MTLRVRSLAPLAALALACAHGVGRRPAEERPTPTAPRGQPTAPSTPRPPRERPTPSPAPSPAPAPAPAQPGTRAAPVAGPGEYYPLAVGNEWIYVDQSPSLPAERRGARRTVKILERTPDGFFRDNGRGELRVEGDCLRDRQRRILCLPIQAGNSWSSKVSVSSTERYEIAGVRETVETPAGKFDGCVRVRAHNRASASTDHVLEITYAPGVGAVRIETYVVVDGKVTPQIKAVLQSYRLEGR